MSPGIAVAAALRSALVFLMAAAGRPPSPRRRLSRADLTEPMRRDVGLADGRPPRRRDPMRD